MVASKKDNIQKFDHCYGCGVCEAACPTKIIKLKEDSFGFYSPYIINEDKCINCGICLKVCAFNYKDIVKEDAEDKEFIYFAGWNKNPLLRERCSSGGLGFELGKYAITHGYKAVGVRYNPKTNRAEHFIASSIESFTPSIGSKYIPSYTSPAFSGIKRKEKYFVTGTPCQIDSFRRYIRHFKIEDNFILMDFFCHGVPSLFLWDKYISDIKKKIGNVTFASWRNKSSGWHDSYSILIKNDNRVYSSKLSQGDLFFKLFLGNTCLNLCCYKDCKYKKTSSAADIRIGDLWGKKYSYDEKGTSSIIAFTDKGKKILEDISNECELIREPENIVTEGQMIVLPKKPKIRLKFIRSLQSQKSLNTIYNRTLFFYRLSKLPKRVYHRIKRSLNLD